MIERLAADALLLGHLLFILFVLLGGLLVWRWRSVAWLHLPAVAWAALAQFYALQCPLTPLEIALRRAAGQAGYSGGFIEHYLLALIYPADLTPQIQLWLGLTVLACNAPVYLLLLARLRRRGGG